MYLFSQQSNLDLGKTLQKNVLFKYLKTRYNKVLYDPLF